MKLARILRLWPSARRAATDAGMSDHPTIRPQPGILDIALYQGGESKLPGRAKVLKLSSNENPFGPSARTRVFSKFKFSAYTRTLPG